MNVIWFLCGKIFAGLKVATFFVSTRRRPSFPLILFFLKAGAGFVFVNKFGYDNFLFLLKVLIVSIFTNILSPYALWTPKDVLRRLYIEELSKAFSKKKLSYSFFEKAFKLVLQVSLLINIGSSTTVAIRSKIFILLWEKNQKPIAEAPRAWIDTQPPEKVA